MVIKRAGGFFFVYEGTATLSGSSIPPLGGGGALSYINFEEGRIRVIQPVLLSNGYDALVIDGNMDLPEGKKGVYDYYIRDYQENVRMILTEESHFSMGKCTMETSRASNEEPVFGQTGGGNEVATTRFSTPSGWQSNSSGSVSKLSKAIGKPIGPNGLLKVMAGDEINATTQYYYTGTVSNNNNSFVSDVVNNLISAITGSNAATSAAKGSTAGIGANLNGSVPFANFTDPNKNSNDNYPRAYLSVLFFDERFNFIEEGSAIARTMQAGDGAAPLVLANLKAPKNGYAYIYVSNENDDPVYFDNLQVSHNKGRIIEENHYYAFGLKIAGISSKKLGDSFEGMLDNKNLYNDKELIDDADLDWYDYGFRNYDAQIGRFPQLDPLTDDYPELTPFQYGGNDPIANIDLDGLEGVNILGEAFQGAKNAVQPLVTVVGHAAPKVAQGASTASKILSIASMTANAAKLYTTLDGQKSLSSDIENRLYVNQVKEINKHWVHVEANKYENTVTGQTWYKPTAAEAVYPEIILVPLPKVGWAFKVLGRGGEAGVEASVRLLEAPAARLTQDRFEHILERHWYNTIARNVGKFSRGTTARNLKQMINTATRRGTFKPNTFNRPGTIAEYDFGRAIGTNTKGQATSTLKVVINPNGTVNTAYPY